MALTELALSDLMKLTKEKAGQRMRELEELKQAGLMSLDAQFFPSVHYPPITIYPSITEDALFKTYKNPEDDVFSIYVHIPFCINYCVFCHYPILIGASHDEKQNYLDTLKKEMDLYMNRLGISQIKTRSILIGGGTPTHLTPEQLKYFLEYFSKRVDFSRCTQHTWDVDPNNLIGPEGEERLRILKDYGVSRLTIGIQSFDEGLLKKMNRAHDIGQAVKSIERTMAHGMTVNIEFIYGYPNQTMDMWVDTIMKAISLDVEEIQIYRLKVIPYGDHGGTVTRQFGVKPEDFPGLEDTMRMKIIAMELLNEHGYNEGLTRIFAKTPQEYSHYADDQCCKLRDQIGFGITAFNSLRDRFGLNTMDYEKYYKLINEENTLPVDRGLVRTHDDQLRWSVILPLKNRKIFKKYYEKINGISIHEAFGSKIARLKEFGLLYEDEQIIRLTPLGRFWADETAYFFGHPKYLVFPKISYANGPLNPYLN